MDEQQFTMKPSIFRNNILNSDLKVPRVNFIFFKHHSSIIKRFLSYVQHARGCKARVHLRCSPLRNISHNVHTLHCASKHSTMRPNILLCVHTLHCASTNCTMLATQPKLLLHSHYQFFHSLDSDIIHVIIDLKHHVMSPWAANRTYGSQSRLNGPLKPFRGFFQQRLLHLSLYTQERLETA